MKPLTFADQQRRFLAYLRQPASHLLPAGVAAERMAVYAELLFNSFDESLSACFPVLRSILPAADWQSLVADFILKHRCLTPYYRQIPGEFMVYLQTERQASPADPPFLLELAHFEWIELVLSVAEAAPQAVKPLSEAEVLDEVLVFAPAMMLLQYQWPVQQISVNAQPAEADGLGVHILGFRDAAEQVRFVALTSATAGLLQGLLNGQTARRLVAEMAGELGGADGVSLAGFARDLLLDLYAQGAILGAAAEQAIDIEELNR